MCVKLTSDLSKLRERLAEFIAEFKALQARVAALEEENEKLRAILDRCARDRSPEGWTGGTDYKFKRD